MGKKRIPNKLNFNLTQIDSVNITMKNNSEYFFEIEEYVTDDVAEAVALMMRKENIPNSIWQKEIEINLDNLDYRKSLYWLTGGDNEWIKLKNYKMSWQECESIFVDEFDFIIKWIMKKSKKLEDIKSGFKEYLNLTVIYDFALRKKIIE